MSDDPRNVLQDRAMGMEAVFRPLQRGKREKLDVQTQWGEATIRWRGPDQLGIGDQSVLLAVLEVAMEQLREGEPVRTDEGLWRKLGHQKHVFKPELARSPRRILAAGPVVICRRSRRPALPFCATVI